MAISYVGGVQGGRAGSTSTTTQSLSGTLTGGSDTSPSTGDLVVVWCAAGADTTAAAAQSISGNNSGAYTALTEQSSVVATTYDTYSKASYKIQGTVDTTLTIPSSGSARNAQRWIVHVFRGVDATTPLDVTSTYATGTGTGRPNPALIAPTTAGAWILAFYASAAATGAAYTAPTDFATDWLGGTTADTADVMTGGGYYTGWTSGNYDPAAITAGGTTNAADTWTATTIALRPALPAFTQASYRFYEDGTETGSTAIDAQDTNITEDVSGGDSNLQLRVRLQETNGTAGESTDDYQLQYELNDGGTYLNVGTGRLIDSYNESNATTEFRLDAANDNTFGQIITGDGRVVGSASFYMFATGSPTGNAVVKIYAITGTAGTDATPTGAALATSDNVAASSIPVGIANISMVSFAFSGGNQITLTNGTSYALSLEYSSGDASNYIRAHYDSSSPTHAGNFFRTLGGSLAGFSNADAGFYLISAEVPLTGYNSASLTDGNATTNRLGSGTGSFVAGEISEDGLVDDLQITASNYTELLYSLTIDSDAVDDADTLDFRVLRNGATTGLTYTVTPRITIEKATTSAAITGTATASITEADIVTGGKTIIITLTGDTFLAAGTGPIGTTANTQALIDNIDSAQSEGTGWDAVVKVGIETTDVVRTSDTVATITLDAEATYNITATETITVTVPAAVLTGASPIVATPTFTISPLGSGTGNLMLLGAGA